MSISCQHSSTIWNSIHWRQLTLFALTAEVAPRALREIYLRAFELVLRAPNPPWAVMTCYNRINGLHASESPWLLDTVLRSEWGWRGMIVSDWFGTYSADLSVRAGLDLEMPVRHKPCHHWQ
jgi:beta-glucosidase